MIGPQSRKLPPGEWLAGLSGLGLLSTSASTSQPEELLSTSIAETSEGLLSLLSLGVSQSEVGGGGTAVETEPQSRVDGEGTALGTESQSEEASDGLL